MKRNAHRCLMGNLERKNPLRRSRSRREYDIKMGYKNKIGCVDWNYLPQDRYM
jgi:hypothetical protein